MKSEKVMLTLALALLTISLGGCLHGGYVLDGTDPVDPWDVLAEALRDKTTAGPLDSPYAARRLWVVAPPTNKSGMLNVDTPRIADRLVQQLQNARNIDVLPVNRVLEAMEVLGMAEVRTKSDAFQLMRELGADGIVIGLVTAYDPYDPPKLGLTIELYVDEKIDRADPANLRALSIAATDEHVALDMPSIRNEPTVIEGFYDAANPDVRRGLRTFANLRGPEDLKSESWRRYRISMDLYTEFVSYVMSWRLLHWETMRLPEIELESSPG